MPVEVDLNDVLNSLSAQIGSLTVQNASLQAQLIAYQKADEAAASRAPLAVVPDDDDND